MDGKYRHSLMLICILAVFCLLALDNSAFCRTETRTSDDKILSSAYDWEEQGESVCYITKNGTISKFPGMTFTWPARPCKRSNSLSISGAAIMTVLVSRRYFLYVPKEERFFACFQPAIFLCARFLRELLILFKKDGKNGERSPGLDII